MNPRAEQYLRWVATSLFTLTAGVITLGVVWIGAFLLLETLVGLEYGTASWYAKAATTPFVTAVLVYAAWRLAPAKKGFASAMALAVACAWAGAFLMFGVKDMHAPLILMGAFGLPGGIGTYLMLRAQDKQ